MNRPSPIQDYSTLTEQWGDQITPQQAAMARTRYHWAGRYAEGQIILELACGSGFGLEYLSHRAKFAIGADLTHSNLRAAQRRITVPLLRVDAHSIPISDGCVDVVVVFEAIYYFANPAHVLEECRRVLRPSGSVVLSLPNPDCPGFHRSPASITYPSVPEFYRLLDQSGFESAVWGAFPVTAAGWRSRAVAIGTRPIERLGLVPKTLHGRSRIKRLIYGRLEPLAQLGEDQSQNSELIPLSPEHKNSTFKNLYGLGTVK